MCENDVVKDVVQLMTTHLPVPELFESGLALMIGLIRQGKENLMTRSSLFNKVALSSNGLGS